MLKVSVVAYAFLVACACGTVGPRPDPSQPPGTLWLESRGAPAVALFLDGAEIARLTCGGAATFRPAEGGVPALPWELELRTVADDRSLYKAEVAGLPRWIVLMGEAALTSDGPIFGPPGPACP